MIHRRVWRLVTGLVIVAALSTIGVTPASASLPSPPDAYPVVTPPPTTCPQERTAVAKAQTAYDSAAETYRRSLGLFYGMAWRGISAKELGEHARGYYAAAIALSNAKYRLSQCANLRSLPPSVCVAIALELNRLNDQTRFLMDERNSIEAQRRFYEEHRSLYNDYATMMKENADWLKANQDARTYNSRLKTLYEFLALVFLCPPGQRPLTTTAAPGDSDVAALAEDETIEELTITELLNDDEITSTVQTVMAPFVEPMAGDESSPDFGDVLANLIHDALDGEMPSGQPTPGDAFDVSTSGPTEPV